MSRCTDLLNIAGTELCIRNGISDRVLLLLHGIGSNYSSFDQLAEYMPPDVELVCWNAPGYGQSLSLESSSPTAIDYAHRLHEIVRQLELDRFSLLGHSLGTLIATQYANQYPEKVDNLILLSCAEGYSMAKGAPLPAKAQQRLTDLKEQGARKFAQQRAPRLMHKPENKPLLVKSATEAMAAIHPEGYTQAVHMLAAGQLAKVAGDTHINSLIITGSEDRITPTQQSRACHEALVGANPDANHQFIEISEAGHLVHQEQPMQVANRILNFTGWNKVAPVESMA